MRTIRGFVAVFGLIAAASAGFTQVVSPPEILDGQLRELQQKHMTDLKKVATEISAHSFPYRLYFSRTLDLSEEQQKRSDQRSIRFDKFHGQTVLEITANYYASYSAELMQKEQRARRTLQDVAVPMLESAIPALADEDEVQSFAIEISHHVRRKILGVRDENCENVALILPAAAAKQMMAATTSGEREAALMQGQLFVDRQPVEGWGQSARQAAAEKTVMPDTAPLPRHEETRPTIGTGPWNAAMAAPSSESPKAPAMVAPVPAPDRPAAEAHPGVSAESLRKLQESHQADLDCLVRELDKQAHFVSYAPPAFVAFHKGTFLQVSLKTTLKESAPGSPYQMAALAFDEHIAHLIRPVLASLKGLPDFDGIDFSTTVRLAGTAESGGVAVEFIFPSNGLISYQNYDLTGQQLIDMGFLLINGERVSLELQRAEASLSGQP